MERTMLSAATSALYESRLLSSICRASEDETTSLGRDEEGLPLKPFRKKLKPFSAGGGAAAPSGGQCCFDGKNDGHVSPTSFSNSGSLDFRPCWPLIDKSAGD